MLVICIRIDYKDRRWKYPLDKVVEEVFKDCTRTEFSPKYLDKYNSDDEMIAAKKETAQEIVKYIIDKISKQNEN